MKKFSKNILKNKINISNKNPYRLNPALLDYLPIYYLLIMAIRDSAFLVYTIIYNFAKIQTNLEKYLFLIFQKLVETYFK